jgi:hypothetical protein
MYYHCLPAVAPAGAKVGTIPAEDPGIVRFWLFVATNCAQAWCEAISAILITYDTPHCIPLARRTRAGLCH